MKKISDMTEDGMKEFNNGTENGVSETTQGQQEEAVNTVQVEETVQPTGTVRSITASKILRANLACECHLNTLILNINIIWRRQDDCEWFGALEFNVVTPGSKSCSDH